MVKRIFLVWLTLLHVLSLVAWTKESQKQGEQSPPFEVKVGKYSQRFADIALDQRLCFTMAVGFDFVAHSLSHILDRYLKFYNNPRRYIDKSKNHKRVKDLLKNIQSIPDLDLNVHFLNPQQVQIGSVYYEDKDENGDQALVLSRPVNFEIDGKERGFVSGSLEFGLHIAISLNKTTEKNMWHLRLGNRKETAVSNYKCERFSEQDCKQIREYLEMKLSHDVIALNQAKLNPYDQPTAARDLVGLLNYINDFTARPRETTHMKVVQERKVFHLFFNCKAASVEDSLSKVIMKDQVEFGFYQNLFDNFGVPHELEIDLQALLKHPKIQEEYKDQVQEVVNTYKMTPVGQVRITKDPITLGQLLLTKVQSPRIKNETAAKKAKRPPHVELDKISVHQNILIQIEDKAAGADLAILPLEVNTHFFARHRPGHLMRYGRTQEIKGEYGGTEARLRDCQFIPKEYQLNYDAERYAQSKKALDDEDDDFEDEDEEDDSNVDQKKEADSKATRKVKPSNIAGLVCSMKDKINELLAASSLFDDHFSLHDYQQNAFGQFSEYYPMPEKDMSRMLLCAGVEVRQPIFWADTNRLVATIDLDKNLIDVDTLCDSMQVMEQVDPRRLYLHESPERQQEVNKKLALYEDTIGWALHHRERAILGRLEFPHDHFWLNKDLPGILVHYFSSYTFLKDWCKKHHPNVDGSRGGELYYDNCALAHVNHRGPSLEAGPNALVDYSRSPNVMETFKTIERYVFLALGMVVLQFWFLKISFQQKYIILGLILVNVSLGSVYLFNVNMRYGIDYIAYIQQAGAVYNGERNYTMLSSNLGPCYYPAGHIWHYLPAYWLHLQTEQAEVIVKFVHVIVHTVIIVYATKIAYLYFSTEHGSGKPQSAWKSLQAQCIAFIILSNLEERPWYANGMYNDQIMMMYLLISIYSFACNRPILGSFWFTMALGVKAGVILILPALLGSVMYNHGLMTLLLCCLLIVSFQVLIAAPFLMGETTVKDYLERSKLTGAGRGGFAGAAEFWDYMAAAYDLTIFWQYIPQECYYDRSCLADRLRLGILAVNVYHFFIRKGCTMQCLRNLADFLKLGGFQLKERAKVRFTIELLLIGYFSGVVLMPGANIQFQFWFMPLVPILVEMVGLPLPLTALSYSFFYPINSGGSGLVTSPGDPMYQHLFLLGLAAWLLTVGPRENLFDLNKYMPKPDLQEDKKKTQ